MTSAYLNRSPRSRLQAAYDVCPELREAVQALAFYADGWEGHAGDSGPGGNWPADPDCWPGEALQDDCGRKARTALATIQAMESEK